MSLLEVLVVSGLFLALTTILFTGWNQAARAWQKSSARGEMVTVAQTVFRGVERELEDSSALGVDLMATPIQAFSFPSVFPERGGPDAGSFEVDPNGNNLYRKFVIFYRKASSKELMRTEFPIPAGHQAEKTPVQISLQDFGSGPHPLEHYALGGKRIGSRVEDMIVQRDDLMLTLILTLSTEDARSETYRSSTFLRN